MLNCERHALADADAKGCEAEASPTLFELMGKRECQARPAHAEWMAKRDSPAIRIHMLGIVSQANSASRSPSWEPFSSWMRWM